jgi:hypothetical protein
MVDDVAPQQELAFACLGWFAMAVYFSRTIVLISVFEFMAILINDEIISATGFFVLCFQGVEERIEFGIEFFKCFPVDAIATAWSVDGAIDEACVLQFFEMLANGALGQGENFYNLATNTFVVPCKHVKDSNTGRVTYSFCKCRQ